MDAVNLSQANQVTLQKQQTTTKPQVEAKPEQKKNGKKMLAIGAAAAATIAIAGIAIYKGKKNKNVEKANELFSDLVNNAKKGSNVILSDEIQKESDAVADFIKKNPEDWEKLKKKVSGMVDIKNADEVLQDGILYHGTSVESAKSILKNGVTPFSPKRAGSGSGMGYGFYSTPDLKAAQFYSNGNVVLPFELNGAKIATLKDGVKPEQIKGNIMADVKAIIDPPKTSSFYHMPNSEAQKFANDNQSYLTTKIMQELGIDAIYTKGATSRGGLLGGLNMSPEFLDNAGQIAVFNGDAVKLSTQKAKELNVINADNCWRFKEALQK